jgi:hypothetical protein
MRIAGIYSFKGGREYVQTHHPDHFKEVIGIIQSVDSQAYRTKTSMERSKAGHTLYSPVALNQVFQAGFEEKGWISQRVWCSYPDTYYVEGYQPTSPPPRGAFREMDFVKDRLGVEVQLGKYAFMVYNVCAKMTIFRNLNLIDAGIEIVPVKDLAVEMSSGVSYFEQFVWDLEARGVSDIDIPVVIIGIAL